MFERSDWQSGNDSAFRRRWTDSVADFKPWGSVADAPASPEAAPVAAEISLWDAAYAAGRHDALAEAAAGRTEIDRLAHAMERLSPMPPAELADALTREVRALLRRLIGEAGIDEALLTRRCAELAALAHDAGQAILRAHPDDAALLSGADWPMTIRPDPTLQRGELRLCDGPGEIAAGPHTMLDSWDDAPC
jgi:hypothetical protein